MRSYAEFYESLNEALQGLPVTGTIELELQKPLYLAEVRALAFRLIRRNRAEQVRTLKMRCEFKEQERECLSVLEQMLGKMKNLDGLFLSNLSRHGCSRVVRGCRGATLSRLAIGCNITAVGSCIQPDTLLELSSPANLEKLGIGYVDGSRMDGFVLAISAMPALRELGLGFGHGTTDEACNMLLSCVSGLQELQALYLWAPEDADFCFSTHSSLSRFSRILNNGVVTIVSLEDLPGLFSDQKCQAFGDFMASLEQSTSLRELTLEGDLGLGEEATIAIFQALEKNETLREFQIRDVPLSWKGWKTVLDSLARNRYLDGLGMRTVSVPSDTTTFDRAILDVIISRLQRNASLLFFSCHIASKWRICSHNEPALQVWADRNQHIRLAVKVTPSNLSDSLLPLAVARILTLPALLFPESCPAYPCYAAAFPLLQNFASRLAENELNTAATLAMMPPPKKKQRCTRASAPTRTQPSRRSKRQA